MSESDKSSSWLLFVWRSFFSLTFLSQLPLLMMPLSLHLVFTKHFPVLLRTKKLAQHTSQYYFVLQSLHQVLPSTTWYYKGCAKYFPVLFRSTKLAQSTSQYYFVLQSLHKVLPSTTSYYKAGTKYFPVLLRTTKLAQNTSQLSTLYYKACTKFFPVLLRTTKAQSTSQ